MTVIFPQPCPQLPDFQSLLLKGPYHASAPIHLVLSHLSQNPDNKAIFLTPHRALFKKALVGLNDGWLDENAGQGRVCAAAQRVEIFYPPTLAHMRLLLSMLHEYNGVLHHPKTTLELTPNLVVLHEISSYFNTPSSDATVSAYLSLISSAFDLTSSWSPQCAQPSKLVVFDSGLAELKLPILKPLTFGDQADEPPRNRGMLSILLERYFEWTAEVHTEEQEEDVFNERESDEDQEARLPSPQSATTTRKSMRIRRCNGIDLREEPDVVWRWTEIMRSREDDMAQTTFDWDG